MTGLPAHGRSYDDITAELAEIARGEDAFWETGKMSGSMYCGDHDHYDFQSDVFAMFAHVNALQRDVCPSVTRFESEIISMTLDLLHSEAARERGHEPVGLVTSGGTLSIFHAMYAYREANPHIGRPNVIKPETAHAAFDKACHILGIELRRAPIDQTTTLVDLEAAAGLIDENTIAIIGSAGNYGYGTIDPIGKLSDLAIERGIGLHVDGCLGGFILPFGEELGHPIAPFDFRHPGVTSMSIDTHKYGYGLKGSSVLVLRDKGLRNGQYFFLTDWSGGKYCSPSIDGSRSAGLLAATWASLVATGRDGYLAKARKIFATSYAMQAAVREHPELRIFGEPSFLFAFTSDAFDIFHVNDSLKQAGWRMNAVQYPNGIHMCVTNPQTQDGLVEVWKNDLWAAVGYAREHAGEPAKSNAIYGGVVGGMTDEADSFIRSLMSRMMDRHTALG
jgi:sphinganine-1-phosphate aldolase